MDLPLVCALVLATLIVGMALGNRALESYLILKARPQDRTAFCLRGKFYYIVPEKEYVQLSADVLTRRLNDDAWKGAGGW